MTNHILLYLACEHMVIEVKQPKKKKSITRSMNDSCTRTRQPMNEMCTKARRPVNKILCMGVRHLPGQNVHVGVRPLEMGVRHHMLEFNNSRWMIGIDWSQTILNGWTNQGGIRQVFQLEEYV
jgi:hypothetical protein